MFAPRHAEHVTDSRDSTDLKYYNLYIPGKHGRDTCRNMGETHVDVRKRPDIRLQYYK
jgi:hypothetical protein